MAENKAHKYKMEAGMTLWTISGPSEESVFLAKSAFKYLL
jgi:hypothetical protein